MIAPHARHHRRHAIERTFCNISAFNVGKIFTREDGVSMTKHNGIHARYFTKIINGVFRHRLIRVGRKAGVSNHHHDIGAFFPHFRHILTRGFGDVIYRHFAAEVGFIPGHDLWWHKADIANLQRLLVTFLVDHLSIFDQIRRKQRLFGLNVDDIGVNVGELRPGQRVVQILQTVVEFMVAEVTHRVIQRIERLIYRVNFARFQPFGRHVIPERTALNQIAVINQHAVFDFTTRGVDQTCRTHQAKFFSRRIFVIIEIHHIAMQISGFHYTQIDGRGIHAGCNQRCQKRCTKLNHQGHPFKI